MLTPTHQPFLYKANMTNPIVQILVEGTCPEINSKDHPAYLQDLGSSVVDRM